MTVRLRVGTRGSDLALTQTRWVCDQLRAAHPDLEIDETIIETHGDRATDQPFDADWPVGSFVSALERALIAGDVDFAVHSYKDLPSLSPEGLVIAAVPPREVVHDVLVCARACDLDGLPGGFRIGTSSPRRIAQMKRLGDIETVPVRGNVPTRIRKIASENLDAVVLAAAGLKRLRIEPTHVLELPTDRFVPSPAQGALAVQTREDDPAEPIVAALDDADARRAVEAERAFLAAVEAGCQTPLGALAALSGKTIALRGQLFSDDGADLAEDVEAGQDPIAVGRALAERLLARLGQ